MIYITSDTHFNHVMLVREKKRKFSSVTEMNEKIISEWNSVVTDNDTIFHLGDVVLNNKTDFLKNILHRLKGKIIFIKGNHDSNGFTPIRSAKINFKGTDAELIHNPFESDSKYIIHGHLHDQEKIRHFNGKIMYNTTTELHDYKPKLLNEIIGEMKKYESENSLNIKFA